MTSKSSTLSDESARLRSLMLESAREMVEASGGLRVSLDGLSLDQVIKEAKVPRTSAYRIWPNREAFHQDVMRELAAPNWADPKATGEQPIQLMRMIVAEHLDDLETLAGRKALLELLSRTIAEHSYRGLAQSPVWRTSIALSVASTSMPDPAARAGIVEAMSSAESTWLNELAQMYEDAATLLGMTMREGLTYDDLALVIASTLDGMLYHAQSHPDDLDVSYTLSMDGQPSPGWHLAGLAVLFLFESLVQFDEEYDRAAALSAYLKRLASR